ncbi:MAG: undecaprenyldiphospho-muramoylpentapeptide beta-N-acetylglucosaminyltransferase [Candidatus Sericytochromatia bacterium]
MKRKRIAIACGGTGGHIYPGLTIGSKLQQYGLELFFMGSSSRMEKDAIPAAGFDFIGLPVQQINKKNPVATVANWGKCMLAARAELKRRQPAALVGLGSYITVPAILAARQLGIPVFLIETNVVPGKANRALGRLAQWVALAYAETAAAFGRTPTHVTGSPVRPEFGSWTRQAGAEAFGLDPQQGVLSIIGGSQGAKAINDAVVAALPQLLAHESLQIVHVCGASNHDQIRAQTTSYTGHPRYRLLHYVDNMPALLATTDLAISRAGASTIAELMVCRVPPILVPGRFGGGHQLENAQAVAQAGAGILLPEAQLQAEALSGLVSDVISDTERLNQMRQNCSHLNTSDAADKIAHLILNSLKMTKKEALSC